ncbi:uncharacterized protein LOC131849722 [Achroia grisella]|uniref:uncharacterized protein LOC131849722 n=1 Tax=Achroia grisella TaxID=688607 RepID=UPI0027D28401|nr:uncharacterized protein LOC131849722 [Achroia grisella]
MLAYLQRRKRSIEESNAENNETKSKKVLFHDAVDEINQDTLKNTNSSGTIEANKVVAKSIPQISRRTGLFNISNITSPLHIAYKSQLSNRHIADNKINTPAHDDKYYTLSQEKVHKIFNQTQKTKDKELSKMIVNELKAGTEIVGDKHASIMSNITFTSENDTLTAMAFIAGNLLNKLWNIERDARDESMETEILKHEKISDLIELFKEPLSLRQEIFLKNALEQLSEAVNYNKDPSNASLCEKIEKAKNYLEDAKDSQQNEDHIGCKKHNEENGPKQNTSLKAIEKMSNILGLLQKFETVQKHISNLEHEPLNVGENKPKFRTNYSMDEFLTKDESSSLNIYGKILEKITKLIIPKKKCKKITNRIRNQNIFQNNDDIKAKLKALYGVDLGDINLTVKDKLIFDYLFNIKNQRCPMQRDNLSPVSNTEGDILLNLSEFFKVKSITDLVNLLEPSKQQNNIFRTILSTTTAPITESTVSATTLTVLSPDNMKLDKLNKTKEKLKNHLKSIINDLIELQNVSGIPVKDRKIQIYDILPCIFNVFNKDFGGIKSSKYENPIEIVKNLFEKIKKDFKYIPQTRRFSSVPGLRPKSAVIWERVAKNLGNKQKLNTRRNLDTSTKSYEDIKKEINKVENSGSNVYKNQAIQKNVHPAKKLVLLKALNEDVKQYIDVLKDINVFVHDINNVAADKKINKYNGIKNQNTRMQPLKLHNVPPSNNKLKLSRDEIVNQLIKNRLELYLKIKHAEGVDLDADINSRIANKILNYLQNGNNNLARDLYKVFVARNEQSRFDTVPRSDAEFDVDRHSEAVASRKEPIIPFEDINSDNNPTKPLTKDLLIKQLLNIKNM